MMTSNADRERAQRRRKNLSGVPPRCVTKHDEDADRQRVARSGVHRSPSVIVRSADTEFLGGGGTDSDG